MDVREFIYLFIFQFWIAVILLLGLNIIIIIIFLFIALIIAFQPPHWPRPTAVLPLTCECAACGSLTARV